MSMTMSSRATSIGVGLMLAGLATWAALGADDQRDIICQPGYSATIRMSKEQAHAIKLALCAAQDALDGTPVSHCLADNELDHIRPLELGCHLLDGSDPNSLSNLQLQLWPIARAKDQLEDAATRDYCAGEITHPQACAQFHRDAEISVIPYD